MLRGAVCALLPLGSSQDNPLFVAAAVEPEAKEARESPERTDGNQAAADPLLGPFWLVVPRLRATADEMEALLTQQVTVGAVRVPPWTAEEPSEGQKWLLYGAAACRGGGGVEGRCRVSKGGGLRTAPAILV